MNKEEAIQILSTRDAHGVLCGYTSGYQEALDMAIEALRHDVIFEQIKWERDVALDTLEKHGIGLGQKYEPSTDAEEEVLHKILESGMIELPQEYASVVRCKDCKYMTLDETNKYQIWCSLDNSPWYEDDFCSRAKMKGGVE